MILRTLLIYFCRKSPSLILYHIWSICKKKILFYLWKIGFKRVDDLIFSGRSLNLLVLLTEINISFLTCLNFLWWASLILRIKVYHEVLVHILIHWLVYKVWINLQLAVRVLALLVFKNIWYLLCSSILMNIINCSIILRCVLIFLESLILLSFHEKLFFLSFGYLNWYFCCLLNCFP